MILKVPVVLFTFNRPDLTARVISALSPSKPKTLYFVSDGPRDGVSEDLGKVHKTRSLLSLVDWDCEVVTIFSDVNLGLPDRFFSALDQVFQIEKWAIILEDDCLPGPDFFVYARRLLEMYEGDDRVGIISGHNFAPSTRDFASGYFFSKTGFIWGWATWGSVWANFTQEFRVSEFSRDQVIEVKGTFSSNVEKFFVTRLMRILPTLQTWDIQFNHFLRASNKVNAVPAVNLVENIGFTSDATHTVPTPWHYPNPALDLGAEIESKVPPEESVREVRRLWRRKLLRMASAIVRFYLVRFRSNLLPRDSAGRKLKTHPAKHG